MSHYNRSRSFLVPTLVFILTTLLLLFVPSTGPTAVAVAIFAYGVNVTFEAHRTLVSEQEIQGIYAELFRLEQKVQRLEPPKDS